MHAEKCYSNKSKTKLICDNETKEYKDYTKNETISFTNYRFKSKLPFIVCAGIECYFDSTILPNGEPAMKYASFSLAMQFVSIYPEVKESYSRIFTGEEYIKDFIAHMIELEKEVDEIFLKYRKNPKKFDKNKISKNYDPTRYSKETICWICNKEILKNSSNCKVLDHDHFNGDYRGAAHKQCNLLLNLKEENINLPVYFLNGSKHDFNFIVKELANQIDDLKKIGVIPKADEKYLEIKYGILRFRDSLHLFSPTTTVEELRKSLSINDTIFITDYCRQLSKKAGISQDEATSLLMRKGVFPYEFMDSHDKYLLKGNELRKKDFFSSLLGKEISDMDFEHFREVYATFKCNDMLDYTEIYNRLNVLIITDAIQKYRNIFDLDPAYFICSPSLTWQLALLKTGIRLDIIPNQEIHDFFEHGIRGGVSTVLGDRYVKANNKHMEDYNDSSESVYILYIGLNNLYGEVMRKSLPYKLFEEHKFDNLHVNDAMVKVGEWINKCRDSKVAFKGKKREDSIGCAFRVDLEYESDEAKKKHERFPLAPVKRKVKIEELSEYQKNFLTENNLSFDEKSEKLILDLLPKKNYVVYWKNLEYYLKRGIKITRLYELVSFREKPWLHSYIDENNANGSNTETSELEKNLWKLMNNACLGKMLENNRNRIDINLVTTSEEFLKNTGKPEFLRSKKFTEDFYACHCAKEEIYADQPIYCGFVILEMAKLKMYKTFYEKLVPVFGDKMSTHYHDTDSWILSFKTIDLYKDIKKSNLRGKLFDFINYNLESETSNTLELTPNDLINKDIVKVPGLFKDELGGLIIIETCILASKFYCISISNEKQITKNKENQMTMEAIAYGHPNCNSKLKKNKRKHRRDREE